jgi:hypothetical protein
MDKVMKAEIEKVLEELDRQIREHYDDLRYMREVKHTAISSLTALIIKWLESKRKQVRYEDVKREMGLDGVIIEREKHITYNKEEEACNQLITELIGEVR